MASIKGMPSEYLPTQCVRFSTEKKLINTAAEDKVDHTAHRENRRKRHLFWVQKSFKILTQFFTNTFSVLWNGLGQKFSGEPFYFLSHNALLNWTLHHPTIPSPEWITRVSNQLSLLGLWLRSYVLNQLRKIFEIAILSLAGNHPSF